MTILAYVLAFVCLILNITLFIRLKPPLNFMFLWVPQLVQHALSPFLVVIGASVAVLGLLVNAPIAAAAAALAASIAAVYIWGVLRQRADFASAFGVDWQQQPERFIADPSHLTLGLYT